MVPQHAKKIIPFEEAMKLYELPKH